MRFAIAAAAITGLLTGCGMMESMTGRAPTAKATLQPIKDSGVKGAATFTQKGDKVQLMADIGGLKPNQEHGFHIHEKGDCNSGDGMGAGGHFNPLGKPHAHPSMPERHAGDMFALKADDYGNATLSIELDVITVTEGPTGIIGRGLIVHAQADDYNTQPTGNAGARVACGVIQKG
ncbi:MAG: superoxide dismutase family protein [Betaproteobacteria bacterium]|nr:MAG: superoxide dismutase family protein [Betaproteobacteria bacterium]